MSESSREYNFPLIVDTTTDELGSMEDLDFTVVTVSQREKGRIVLLSFRDLFELEKEFVDIFGIIEEAFEQMGLWIIRFVQCMVADNCTQCSLSTNVCLELFDVRSHSG